MTETIVLQLPQGEVLRRAASLPEVCFLGDDGVSFLTAFAEDISSAIDPEPSLARDPTAQALPKWVGVLPYEAFRTGERGDAPDLRAPPFIATPKWARYEAVAQMSAERVVIRGSPVAARRLADALGRPSASPERAEIQLVGEEDPCLHAARIERALAHIGRGDFYQVNLARRFDYLVAGRPLDLLLALGPKGHAPFAAALALPDARVVSGSPELCLHLRADATLLTRPIKGTRPRGMSPSEDERLAQELEQSEKERAELAMVVDIERSDVGRISQPGSVRMSEAPHVVSHPTVHHREATVRGVLREEVTREEMLRVMLPSGSVTGAPKVRAMEVIRALEAERRGLYTGALGYLAHDGSLRLSMAIRVLTINGGLGHYFSGGGIVADSVAADEVEETRWKAAQLAPLLGGADAHLPASNVEN